MEEKKYLKWYQKIAYGSGDMAANCSFGIIGSFLLIYLTDTVGLNAGIIGTLMLVSKLLDGVSDVFFGTLVDRTHSKMGKARPWMLWSQIGVSILLVLLFSIPGMQTFAQYAYFFAVYTCLNAVFYTANNIAYASLTSLITKNSVERVQIGSIRFMFSMGTNLFVAYETMNLVSFFGGGTAGWRGVAVLYAVIALAVNTFSCLMVHEVEEEEPGHKTEEKVNIFQSFRYLLTNRYYILILLIYIIMYGSVSVSNTAGIYFCTYVLGDAGLFGNFSMASLFPSIVGLAVVPVIVKKLGIYKVNLAGVSLAAIMSILFVFAGMQKAIGLMLLFLVLKGIFYSPLMGDLNALIAETANYSFKKHGIHLEGTMFSCSSMGMKVGSGIGTAAAGWMLALGGYDGMAAVQSAGAVSMINFMYVFVPAIFLVIQVIILYFMDVEKAVKRLDTTEK